MLARFAESLCRVELKLIEHPSNGFFSLRKISITLHQNQDFPAFLKTLTYGKAGSFFHLIAT